MQISVWKSNFFPRLAVPKILFVLQFSYPWDTRYRVWFDLDNSLTRRKRPFLKIVIRNNSKFPYEKLTFFLGKLYQAIPIFKISYLRNSKISVWKPNFFPRQAIAKILFVLKFSYPWDTRHRVWFDLDNSLTRWIGPFLKFIIRNNSKFPYEKLTFF